MRVSNPMRVSIVIAAPVLLGIAVGVSSALASDVETLPNGEVTTSAASSCREDLRAFEEELDRVGFGVVEPGYYGPGIPPDYNGDIIGATPRDEINSLRRAAYILAYTGREDTCRNLLTAMRQVYADHQRPIGADSDDPNVRTRWRRAHIADAAPVTAMKRLMRADIVIGGEVRNKDDQRLGTIDDIVLDPAQNRITYVLASYGGFLGIGKKLVAIPWDGLSVTEDHEIYVLDVSSEEFEKAPTVDRENFAETADPQWLLELTKYWAGTDEK